MPWTPKALMDIKREFVELASQEGANRRELCRRFGTSVPRPATHCWRATMLDSPKRKLPSAWERKPPQ